MEVEVTQENLTKALSNVGRVASTRSGLPILGNILLRTSGKQLLVAATNLEMAATELIGAKITKQGSITIPARLISEFIQNLPKGTLNLTVKNSHLNISATTNSSMINGVSDEEFPELPVIDETKAVVYRIAADDFKQAVSQTIITASNDATRPVLTGVFWHTVKNTLYLAATDGYRLSERSLMEVKNDIQAIIPVSTLQEVLRTMAESTEEIEVLFDDSQVRFRLDDSEITSRLIDGNFPDYRQLIPDNTTTKNTISKSELLRTVKLANLFARDSGGTINLSADVEKNVFTVKSVASELGENTSEITVEVDGESGSVSLNSRYLIDALNVIEGEMILFGFSGALSPCVIRSSTAQNYTHIVMPIKS